MSDPIVFAVGLILFLFGMLKLSGVIQKLLSASIRQYIRYSVQRPIYGLTVGIASTILLQSSTATTVITVGIVSAGLISFYHSLGIILGADIGTTLTVQLVVWKVTALSPFIMFLGGLLWIAGKEKWKAAGEAAFYFGLMFFGLDMTARATEPLRDNPEIIRFLKDSSHPLTGLLIGLVFTAVVHASAIPISILVILAQHGLISIDNALPIVFGANIGTTATVILASFASNISGKRTAAAHFLFKVTGAAVALAAAPLFIKLLNVLTSSAPQQIALGHFLFNILILLIFFFALKPFSAFLEKALPGREEVLPLWPEFLDERAIARPDEALECVRKELKRQMALANRMARDSLELILDYREGTRRNVYFTELVIDNLQREIVSYLWKVSTDRLSQAQSERLFAFTAMVDDIERIGDHSVNLTDLARHKSKRDIWFTEEGKAELSEISDRIRESLGLALSLIESRDEGAISRIFSNEDETDRLVKASRDNHLERFYRRLCQAEAGPIFIEMLVNLERISDHCENIAEYFRDLK